MKKKILINTLMALFCFCQASFVLAQEVTNVALNKNAYAKSGGAGSAVDGNVGTRWESAHGDNEQWWYVDLGAVYDLESIQIVWEGAYGKSYQILASADGVNWDEENPLASVQGDVLEGFPYTKDITLAPDRYARFIKFQGIERGTGYGYSFWEFRVFSPGVHVTANPILTSVSISPSPLYVVEGETVNFTVAALNQEQADFTACTFSVSASDVAGVEITNNGSGSFSAKGLKEGSYTLTATAVATDGSEITVDNSAAPVTLTVDEARKLETMTISCAVNYAVVGQPVALTRVSKDQYGKDFTPADLTWVVVGEDTNVSYGSVTNNSFTPSVKGAASITAQSSGVSSNEIAITTVASGTNFAQGKVVTTTLDKALTNSLNSIVDGNEGTRWKIDGGSGDGQLPEGACDFDVVIDLGEKIETIDLIDFVWGGAGASYEVYFSDDNSTFGDAVFSIDVNGLVNATHQAANMQAGARYIKIHVSKISTGWGLEFHEVRVYGTKPLEALVVDNDNDPCNLILSGTWDDTEFATIDLQSITSYDLTNVANLPDRIDAKNPNCIFFVATTANAALLETNNVVCDGTAKKLVVKDNYSFFTPQAFVAYGVEYVRTYGTIMKDGYASVVLPFDVKVNFPDRFAYIDWFTPEELSSCNGTYAVFTEVEEKMLAYKPYIMKVSDNAASNNETKIFFNVEVGGTPIEIAATPSTLYSDDKEGYKMVGTLTEISGVGKTFLRNDGSGFAKGGSNTWIPAFHAYLEGPAGADFSKMQVLHEGPSTAVESDDAVAPLSSFSANGVLQVYAPNSQCVNIFTIDGRLAATVELTEGHGTVHGLAKGIYFINNTKVLVK